MWCIYRITNIVNGKTYIGQHMYKDLDDGYMGSGKILRLAIKKYGLHNFSKDILISDIRTRKDADEAEIKMIALERSNGHSEYNIVDGGQGFRGHHSEVAKRKIGKAALGNHYAKGHNVGNKFALGNVLSCETRHRMGVSRMGNANNGVSYIRCVETGDTFRTREWILKGYKNAYLVASGNRKTCKGLHFEYVKVV